MNQPNTPRLTRRRLLAATAAASGLTVQAARAQEQELYEAAKQEAELTWYSGQIQAEPGEAVGRAFTKAYPGIKVNVVRSTSQVAYQRLSQDMQAGVAQCDFFSSTDYGHYLFLKREGKLLPYRPHNMDELIPQARNADPDNMFQVLNIGLYLIATNTQKVPAAGRPEILEGPDGSEMDRPGSRRPSRLQRFGRGDGGDITEALRLGVLFGTGEEQAADSAAPPTTR